MYYTSDFGNTWQTTSLPVALPLSLLRVEGDTVVVAQTRAIGPRKRAWAIRPTIHPELWSQFPEDLPVRSVWRDPSYPNIVITGGHHVIAWSSDGGGTFHKWQSCGDDINPTTVGDYEPINADSLAKITSTDLDQRSRPTSVGQVPLRES